LQNLLRICDLHVYFYTYEGTVKALDGVTFTMNKGDALGIVGESGCGKSTTALSILRLIPPPGKIIKGEIIFNGENLLKTNEDEMRHIRGRDITMIFQEPTTSLNPVFKIGKQLMDVIMFHLKVDKHKAYRSASEILEAVRMPDVKEVMEQYPHELSGGMRQRVMIAMALACKPTLIIADEPTSSLDVTIQAQVLNIMLNLLEKFNVSLLLITHDLGIVAETCDKVIIMYAGVVVEQGNVKRIFKDPKHPYTQGLINAIPKLIEKKDKFITIQGTIPNLINPPLGCKFHPRCPYKMEICDKQRPDPVEIEPEHWIFCFLYN